MNLRYRVVVQRYQAVGMILIMVIRFIFVLMAKDNTMATITAAGKRCAILYPWIPAMPISI